DAVDARDEILQTVRRIEIPVPDLVLLRIEVLFATLFARPVFDKLECRPIDPVTGAERRGQQVPYHERRAPPDLEKFRQDIGSIRPQIRAEKFADGSSCELSE